jgi:predicted ATPase
LSRPINLALALITTAWAHQFRGERGLVQERAEAVSSLSAEHGFLLWEATATGLHGWALAEQGREEEGITQMQQSLAAYQATGAEAFRPIRLALLAEAYGKVGRPEQGLTLLSEALAAVEKSAGRWYEAELYRLRGTLTLQQFQVSSSKFQGQSSPASGVRSPESEAEECFLRAIEIARKQQAKSLELRAVTSLARLWRQQGKTKEARRILAEVYNWFTEGFDTADLKDAKALLEELAGEKVETSAVKHTKTKRRNGEVEKRKKQEPKKYRNPR